MIYWEKNEGMGLRCVAGWMCLKHMKATALRGLLIVVYQRVRTKTTTDMTHAFV